MNGAAVQCETRSLADLVDYCPWCLIPAYKTLRRTAGVKMTCLKCGSIAQITNVKLHDGSFPVWTRPLASTIDQCLVQIDEDGASCTIPSRTRPDAFHKMRLNMNGTMSCTCESWTAPKYDEYRKPCWALKAFRRYWRDNNLVGAVREKRRKKTPPMLTNPVNEI